MENAETKSLSEQVFNMFFSALEQSSKISAEQLERLRAKSHNGTLGTADEIIEILKTGKGAANEATSSAD